MSRKLNFVMVNCWHDSNKGDSAIILGTLRAFSKAADCQFTLVSSIRSRSQEDLEYMLRHVHSEFPESKLISPDLPAAFRSSTAAQLLAAFVHAILKIIMGRAIRSNKVEEAIDAADLIVSKGGQYFAFPKNGRMPLLHMLVFAYPMLYALRIGKRSVYYSHSVGPFHSRRLKWLMKFLCNHSKACLLRETISLNLLRELKVDENKIDVVPDAAWALKIAPQISGVLASNRLQAGKFVAISARDLAVTDHGEATSRQYEQSLVAAICWLVKERGLQVALVAHTQGPIPEEDDRIPSWRIYELLPDNVKSMVKVVEHDLSPSEIAALYGSSRLLIGTRFHALLLAMAAGTPVVGIPYFGNKTTGTFRDVGLQDYLILMTELTPERLIAKIGERLARNDSERTFFAGIAKRMENDAFQNAKKIVAALNEEESIERRVLAASAGGRSAEK
jgi:colanic acid/amylovoran biosynthesis protein